MNEAQLQNAVILFARLQGWLCHHSRPGIMRSGKWTTPIQGDKGLPDLTMVRDGRLIYVELKSERGKVSPKQQQWLSALSECAVEVFLWRPVDWENNTIIETLR